MTFQEVQTLVRELPPHEQLKLAAGICEQLSDARRETEQPGSRRERMLSAIAECDRIADSIEGEFDSAEDLRGIRAERTDEIERAVRGC